ncbi:hypothetical protein RND81_11G085900 [Saponaria officinalis]|uniref:Protein-tyrosine-phosphatase IBR5 n=1 Tax=Saponaria officinalis TaxID=3572 RepID=A0AAW1HKK3_SAPOF
MGKRERENPCSICGHYHKYEEGEVCGICGHRMPVNSEKSISTKIGAFPSEILPDFLYLGSYDNASRSELLKVQGISRILNTVPSCQNLYKNSFRYYSLQDDKSLFFDDAIQFLEKCRNEKARVLVHCMTGKSRSPAVVIAYLMKFKGWRFEQSYQWVKERRPSVELTQAVYEQLQEYEKSLFGASEAPVPTDSLSFGFAKNDAVAVPSFDTSSSSSIFDRPLGAPDQQFAFGASQGVNQVNSGVTDIPMGGA